jgi:hypothetical protein
MMNIRVLEMPSEFQKLAWLPHPRIQEPTSYQEAMSLPETELWLKAMKAEIESLKDNKTWKLVALPPGQIDKYKARMVAKGFSQIAGVDYSDTYSPVIKSDSRNILQLVQIYSRNIWQSILQLVHPRKKLSGFSDY